MAYNLESNIDRRGRENSAGGSAVYLCESSNVTQVDFDSTTGYITGVTLSGGTYFYEILTPRENINFTNGTEINIPNGTYIFRPMVTFNLPGLGVESMKMFDAMVRKSLHVIIKSNENKYYYIGRDNGMDLTSNGSFQLGQVAGDLIGSTIELEGLESSRIAEIDPSLSASIMGTIVSPS